MSAMRTRTVTDQQPNNRPIFGLSGTRCNQEVNYRLLAAGVLDFQQAVIDKYPLSSHWSDDIRQKPLMCRHELTTASSG